MYVIPFYLSDPCAADKCSVTRKHLSKLISLKDYAKAYLRLVAQGKQQNRQSFEGIFNNKNTLSDGEFLTAFERLFTPAAVYFKHAVTE